MPDLERDFVVDLDDDGFPACLPVDWWLALVERDEADREESFEPDPEDVAWWNAQTREEAAQ